MNNQIAAAISIEPDDLDLSPSLVAPGPFEGGNQRGGLANPSAVVPAEVEAHQLFGRQLPKLLDELNEVLAA